MREGFGVTNFEEIFFQVLYVIVALFAHKKLTYEFSVPKYAIFSLGFSILLSIALIRMLKREKLKIEVNLGHILLLGFALTSLISTINVAIDRPFYFFYSIDIALYTLLNAFAAVYITNYFKDKDRIVRFLLVMIATAGFIALDALYNFYTGKDFFLGRVGSPFNRASIKATIGNTIFVANYLGMVIPTTVYFLMSYDFGLRMKKGRRGVLGIILGKVLALVSLILMIITVIVSQTRSEYGGVFLTNLFFFILYGYYLWRVKGKDRAKERIEEEDPELARKLSLVQKTLAIVAIVSVAFFVILYSIPSPLTGEGRFTIGRRVEAMFSASSWDERILAWLSSYYQWKDEKFDPDDIERVRKFLPVGESAAEKVALALRRLFGRGIGTYQILTINYMGDIVKEHPRFIWGWNNFKRTHNDYFQVLGETGVVGLFFILALLLYLVVYLFRTLKRLDDKDDALLFIALAMGFADFAIQSFFSFPGHLLPNTLGAIFLASSALSRHFNKDGWMSFEISFKKGSFAVFAVSLMILSFVSMGLRWNYFISEVNFKAGNTKYLTLMKVKDLRGQISSEERKIGSREDLMRILDGKVRKVSESLIGRKKTDEIWEEFAHLKPSQKFSIVEREIYYEAKERLMRCLSMNHAYGKAYFYLAALSVWYHRVSDLSSSLKTDEDFEKFLAQDFDDFQHFIHPDEKRTDLLNIWKELDENSKKSLRNAFLNFQVILDSISLYETSLLVFNERNTYKALAQRFAILDRYSRSIIGYLSRLKDGARLAGEFQKMSEDYYRDFVKYAKTIIHNIPGSWNRFPDWKNYDIRKAMAGQDIYKTMAKINATLKVPIDPEYQDFLKWLAEKESWATDKMRDMGVWGVPDMIYDYVRAVSYAYLTIGDATSSALWMDYALDLYSKHIEDSLKELEKYSRRIKTDDVIHRFVDSVSSQVGSWIERRVIEEMKASKISARGEAAKRIEVLIKEAIAKSKKGLRDYLAGGDISTVVKPITSLASSIPSVEGVFMDLKAMENFSGRISFLASEVGKVSKEMRDFEDILRKRVETLYTPEATGIWTAAEEGRLMRTFWKELVELRTAEALRIVKGTSDKKTLLDEARKIVSAVKSGKINELDAKEKEVARLAKNLLSLEPHFGMVNVKFSSFYKEAIIRNLQGVTYKRIADEPYENPVKHVIDELARRLSRYGVPLDSSKVASSMLDPNMLIFERYARFLGKLRSLVEEAKIISSKLSGDLKDRISSKVNEVLSELGEWR